MKPLVIVGNEAWTAEEYEAEQARRERRQQYEARPERRARRAERYRSWAKANREHLRGYKREWAARNRAEMKRQQGIDVEIVRVVGSLHSLKCSGPTERTGCRCRKTLIVERVA